MVSHVGAPADEWDHPAAVRLVQDEHDGGLARAASELPPGVDGMEQAFEPAQEISQRRLLVNSPGAGKLGKVAGSR
jgi:hypothetical protein